MRSHRHVLLVLLVLLLAGLGACGSAGDDRPVRAAVASNFAAAFEEIAARFTAQTGIAVTVSAASTGKLYAQIENGAPFDVMLAADQARPARLVDEGLAVADSRFTYAVGRLAICVAPGFRVGTGERGPGMLADADIRHVAIANPRTAPYGHAAVQTLDALGIRDEVAPKLVLGENVGQAMQFVHTGGAEVGLVALSQVVHEPHWLVPADHHDPIRQDAVLLSHASDREDARALLAFLRGAEARAILLEFGYDPGAD